MFYLKVLEIASLYTILVLGVYLMTGLTGLFSLGQGGFVSIGAYTAAVAVLRFGVPFPLALLLAVLMGAALGLVVGIPTLRLRRDYFLLVTFGLGEMVRAALLYLSQLTGGALGMAGMSKKVGLPLILVSIAVITFITYSLKRSRFGRDCVAVRDDELAAAMMGVDVFSQKLKVFVISSGITAYGGALYAFNVLFIEPNLFNWLESAKLIIITFVGGLSSIAGVIVASMVYYSFGEFVRFIDVWRDVLLALVVILVIIFRPGGLFQGLELLPRRLKALRRAR